MGTSLVSVLCNSTTLWIGRFIVGEAFDVLFSDDAKNSVVLYISSVKDCLDQTASLHPHKISF